MQIQFHGAAQTVTGSQYLIQINGKQLLIDCGMFQGPRKESYERNQHFAFDPATVDAAILTHAHIDHSGSLPNLVKKGFSGPIYATPATAQLADIMLRDSGHIQEADAEYLNHRRQGDQPPVEPLYTLEDAIRVGGHFQPVDYGAIFHPLPGVTCTLVDAGHILGSSAAVLDVTENGRQTRLWFSGDIGRRNMPLLRDPVLPECAEVLVMECTYGDQVHPDPDEAFQKFKAALVRAVQRGGKVIVPAFAVGRTQELVYFLNQAIQDGVVPPIPVFVDSPLAVEASKVFMAHPECFDEETRQFVLEGRHPALNFTGLTYVGSAEESKKINTMRGPLVIISASGMAETGRILHHLKNNIGDRRSLIMIVSYQAPNTLGRRLQEGAKQVRIFGDLYDVRAEVVDIQGLSAHAGQDLLVRYACASQKTLKQVFLVHGEPEPAETLTRLLVKEGIQNVAYPLPHQSVDV
ncbi:MAG TPA: MBL fold metallo-hydrolase [Anaerolineaceae bacterium]|jgi:metallo-beta-lactamase family protein